VSPRRLRHLVIVTVVVVLVLHGGGVLHAQTDTGQRITDIQVAGLQRVSTERVMKAIRLRVGDVFSPQAVDEDIRRLDRMGAFYPTGISVRQEPFRDGLRLVFELKERPVVSGIKFVGNRAFSEKKLRETVGLKQGVFVDFARQKESTSAIEELYRAKRYQFVEVKRDEQADTQKNAVFITYTITEGPKVKLKAVRFEGNKAFKRAKLLKQMETRTHRWIFVPQVFDETVFKMDLLKLRQFYKQHGYLDVAVSGDYEYSTDKSKLTLVVRITEGTQYVVGDVTVRGQEVVTGETLRRQLQMKKGEKFGTERYQKDLTALQRFYTSHGYLDVGIEPKEVFPEPGRIDLVYNIVEKQQYRLGLLEIRGNYKTKDKVIRREFGIFPGDVFDASEVEKGVARLRGLRYFETIETTIVPGDVPGEKHLIVEVTEGRTGHLMFGAGVSSNHGIMGQFQLSLENFDLLDCPKSFDDLISGNAFVGGGQRLLLQLSPGTELTQARLFFSDPRIFDTRFSFDVDLFLFQHERDDYDENRIGFRVGVGRKLTDRLSAKLSYRMEEVQIKGIDTMAPDVLAAAGTSDVASVALNLTYDRTDSYWNPSTGYRLSGTAEVAHSSLGSDWDFVRGILEGSYYHPLFETRDGRKHVLAFGARVGGVDALGGSPQVPLFERFYAGGRNSVRGFSYRGLSPQQAGTEVGGEFSFVGNVEYLFPIFQTSVRGQQYEILRGVLFCDVGQVAYRLDDILETRVRASVGFGFRVALPGLGGIPIALDFGFPVSKHADDDTQLFSFNIGTLF